MYGSSRTSLPVPVSPVTITVAVGTACRASVSNLLKGLAPTNDHTEVLVGLQLFGQIHVFPGSCSRKLVDLP